MIKSMEGIELDYRRACFERLAFFFFFKDTAPPEIYPLSLPDALPISAGAALARRGLRGVRAGSAATRPAARPSGPGHAEGRGTGGLVRIPHAAVRRRHDAPRVAGDRKSTRLTPVTVKSRMPSSA